MRTVDLPAAEVLGTKTKKKSSTPLREVGQRLVRLRALARLGTRQSAWLHTFTVPLFILGCSDG